MRPAHDRSSRRSASASRRASYAARSRSAASRAGSSPASTASRTSSRIAAHAGRAAQPLVELVAHQRPGEVELLPGALVRPARRRRGARGGRAPAPRRRRRRRRCSAEQVTHRRRPLARARAPGAARRPARGRRPGPRCSRSPSALLTAITSAISRMPFLMPCSWSPVRARVRNRKVSTIPATVTSDWPTPTVSTSTTSYAGRLEHQHRLAWSPGRRRRGCRRTGEGRMKASRVDRRAAPSGSCRRAPSRRCAPTTGRRRARRPGGPAAVSRVPSASMNVDLPTPGTPEMPTRTAERPASRQQLGRAARAPAARCSGRDDSTSVIARDDRRAAAARGRPRPARRRRRHAPSVAELLAQLAPAGRAPTRR